MTSGLPTFQLFGSFQYTKYKESIKRIQNKFLNSRKI